MHTAVLSATAAERGGSPANAAWLARPAIRAFLAARRNHGANGSVGHDGDWRRVPQPTRSFWGIA